MKIVIDIPKETFKYYVTLANKGEQIGNLERIILDGTPLPKGHGRLIILSEVRIKENQIHLDFSSQNWISEVGLSNATVAIIEADKESENE